LDNHTFDENKICKNGKPVQRFHSRNAFPFSASTLLVGRQEGDPACKKLAVGLLVVMI